MDWLTAVFAFLLVFGGFFGASFLTGAWRRRRAVEANLNRLERALPGFDCGLCGSIDCRDYAASLLQESSDPALCSPGGRATEERLRAIVGGLHGDHRAIRRRAVVNCAGTTSRAGRAYEYDGFADCGSAASLYGGPKLCKDGCLGFGSCVRACPLSAIRLIDGCALIDPDTCTGCGICVPLCPTSVIELVNAEQVWHVACSATSDEERRLKLCDAACTACGECVRHSYEGEFTLAGSVARASPNALQSSADIAQCCPTGAILEVGLRKKR